MGIVVMMTPLIWFLYLLATGAGIFFIGMAALAVRLAFMAVMAVMIGRARRTP